MELNAFVSGPVEEEAEMGELYRYQNNKGPRTRAL